MGISRACPCAVSGLSNRHISAYWALAIRHRTLERFPIAKRSRFDSRRISCRKTGIHFSGKCSIVRTDLQNGKNMAFKPNYRQQRSERDRNARARQAEKLKKLQEKSEARKSKRDPNDPEPAEDGQEPA